MSAAHKCESCFELTSAPRVTCDACHQAGLAEAREVKAAGGNYAEIMQAYQAGCYANAAEVRARRYAPGPAGGPSAPAQSMGPSWNPIPAGRVR